MKNLKSILTLAMILLLSITLSAQDAESPEPADKAETKTCPVVGGSCATVCKDKEECKKNHKTKEDCKKACKEECKKACETACKEKPCKGVIEECLKSCAPKKEETKDCCK